MSYDILGDFGNTGALFNTAAVGGGDQSYTVPAWDLTVDVNAADVSTQVQATNGGKMDSFWQGIGTNLLGYAIAKDAAQSGVTMPGGKATSTGAIPKGTPTKMTAGIQPKTLIVGAIVLAAVFLYVNKA